MSLNLIPFSQPKEPHEELYRDLSRQLRYLVDDKAERKLIVKTALDTFNASDPTNTLKSIKKGDKHFKVVHFKENNEKSNLYIYEKASAETQRKADHSKSFYPCLHVQLSKEEVKVEKAGLLKYNLKKGNADFQHELTMLETVRHLPQVTHLLHSKTYQGRTEKQECPKGLIFLDYFEKGDLKKFIPLSFHTLSAKERFLFFKSLLAALCDLNETHILHNDLKPSNILVSESLQLALADFEFSVVQECDLETFNRFLINKGTIAVNSPERFEFTVTNGKSKAPGLPSNVWSIGCIMYYMLQNDWPLISHQMFTYHNDLKELENINTLSDPEKEKLLKTASAKEIANRRKIENTLKQMKEDQKSNQKGLLGLTQKLLHPDQQKRITAKQAKQALEELYAFDPDVFKAPLHPNLHP